MTFRTYLRWLACSALLMIGLAVAGVYASLGNKVESGRWVAECLAKKSQAVHEREPQLILLAGSNAFFGLSARRLSEHYGVQTVNAGVHAGLGLTYILDYGKRFIRPGRLFVLPLEYELYAEHNGAEALRYQIIGFDADYLRRMSPLKQLQFALSFSIVDRFRHLRVKLRPYPRNDTTGYQSRTVNTWGDETANRLELRTAGMLEIVRQTPRAQFSIGLSAWGDIESFVADVRRQGGQVALMFPNIYAPAFDADSNRAFVRELRERAAQLSVPLIGDPLANTFDESLAFDTQYHQNSNGQSISTDRLYADLVDAGLISSALSNQWHSRANTLRAP